MKKLDGVNIIQITSVKAPTQWWLTRARADAFVQVFGLGDDGKIYEWKRDYEKRAIILEWFLYEPE